MHIFRFFWKHISPYKWHYFIMLLAPIITGFYSFSYNYAVKIFIDTLVVFENLSFQNLLYPITIFMGIQVIMDFSWRMSDIASWKSLPYVRRSIVLDSYQYVQHHSYSYFQNNFTGAISSKIKGILDGHDVLWEEVHYGVFYRLFKIFINLIALSLVSFSLLISIALWCAIYGTVMYRFSLRLNQLSFEETESRHKLVGFIADKISNILTLLSFASRNREAKGLDRYIQDHFIPKQQRVFKYDFKMQLVGSLFYFLMFASLLYYMIDLRIKDLITVGDFAFVFGLILVISDDVWHSTVSLQTLAQRLGDLRSSLSVLETPHEEKDLPGASALRVRKPEIVFKDVHFSYQDGQPFFEGISLGIKAGEKVGLVGKSGSGKSSIVNLLLRYFGTEKGEILVGGQDIRYVTQESLRSQIAVVPQENILFHRSLRDNILHARPDATEEELITACKKAQIHDDIMALPEGYETFAGERGAKLSGGQRQRVSIARALLKKAPILVLDEATSSLDSETEALTQKGIEALVADEGRTVIAIAHRLSTLQNMDRLIVMDQGAIVEEGTHEELIKRKGGVYQQLWESQTL